MDAGACDVRQSSCLQQPNQSACTVVSCCCLPPHICPCPCPSTLPLCPKDFRGNKAFANPPFRRSTPTAQQLRNTFLRGLLTTLALLAAPAGMLKPSDTSSLSQLGLDPSVAARINAAAAAAATSAANLAGLAARVRGIIFADLGYAPEVLLPSRLAAAAAHLQRGSTVVLVSGACSLRGTMFFDDGPLASALIQHAGSLAGLQLKQQALAFNVVPCCWRCLSTNWGCACDEHAWWADAADREFLSLQTAVSLLAYQLEFGVAFGEAAGGQAWRGLRVGGGCSVAPARLVLTTATWHRYRSMRQPFA